MEDATGQDEGARPATGPMTADELGLCGEAEASHENTTGEDAVYLSANAHLNAWVGGIGIQGALGTVEDQEPGVPPPSNGSRVAQSVLVPGDGSEVATGVECASEGTGLTGLGLGLGKLPDKARAVLASRLSPQRIRATRVPCLRCLATMIWVGLGRWRRRRRIGSLEMGRLNRMRTRMRT